MIVEMNVTKSKYWIVEMVFGKVLFPKSIHFLEFDLPTIKPLPTFLSFIFTTKRISNAIGCVAITLPFSKAASGGPQAIEVAANEVSKSGNHQ